MMKYIKKHLKFKAKAKAKKKERIKIKGQTNNHLDRKLLTPFFL